MTDRELLELAAKAAGNGAYFDCESSADLDAAGIGMFFNGERTPDNSKYWNPLTVDGDALRLAVKLQLRILTPEEEFGLDRASVRINKQRDLVDAHDPDPYAATRRAIVRAAATIGKEMP